MPAGWQWGQSPCVQRRALGTVPVWAAGTVPVWALPSPLRDRNVASPLLRNCGVWWAILYLTRRGRHVYGVVRSFYHRCFNRFQMSELEIDLEPFAVHFALTISKSDSSDIISCISFVFRHAGLAGSRDSPRMVIRKSSNALLLRCSDAEVGQDRGVDLLTEYVLCAANKQIWYNSVC